MSKIIQFPEKPEDYKEDEIPGFVECPKCGEAISMKAVKCRHCGIHFSGGVLQYTKPTRIVHTPIKYSVPIVWLLIILIILGIISSLIF